MYYINEENYYFYNYKEIEKYSDPLIREELLNSYVLAMDEIFTEYKDQIDYSLSIDRASNIIQELEEELYSEILFPGDKVKYYSIVKERKSLKQRMCMYSGAIIDKGSYYMVYKGLIKNLSTGNCYVTDELTFEIHSDFRVPETLREFEYLQAAMDNSYETENDELYNLNVNTGGLTLRKFRKNK